MEHLKEQPKKPILVEHHDPEHKEGRKKSISWDEEGIEAYDKERNRTLKITEPKTPYEPDVVEDQVEEGSKDVDEVFDERTKQNTLKNKHLNTAIDTEELHKKIVEKTKEQREKEREREEESEKHKIFLEKRKQHYDEGNKLKEILAKTLNKEEEEEHENQKKNRETHKSG